MAKRLFLLLFSSFIGIFGGPEILMASDDFALSGLNNNGIVETVPIVEDAVQEEEPIDETSAYETSVYEVPAYAPVYEPVYVAPSNTISIAGRTLDVVDVADTTVDAGSHVNKYGDRFFYGHNSAGVFGGLVNVGVGNVFSVIYGGITTTYRVAKVVIYEKNQSSGRLQLNGSGNYMRQVANAKSEGIQYSISLMTCYGESLGGGDATHRLVIFANAI